MIPLLIVLMESALCGLIIQKSYFREDDFLDAGVARQLGFSWSLVKFNGFGHLAPVSRLLHLLVIDSSSLSYGLATTVIVVLLAGLLITLWWTLAELRTPNFVVCCILILVGTSVVLLHVALWFDQVTFLIPASTAILGVTASYLRWERTGRTKWLVSSWLLFACSFTTQERPMVVLTYLVVLRYVVVRPHGTYFKRRVFGDWRLWAPYAVIAAAYVGIYVAGGYFQKKPKPTVSQMIEYLHLAGLEFLRTLVGLPSSGVPGWATEPVVLVAAFLVVAIVRMALHDSRAWKAMVFAGVSFLVNLFPVMSGRVGIYSPFQVASDIQYLLDPMLALGVAVGIGTSQWLVAPARHRHAGRAGRPPTQFRPWGIGAAGVVIGALLIVVHLALVPTGINHELGVEASAATARQFVDNLRTGFAAVERQPARATILPLIAPGRVVPAFVSPYNYEGLLFPILPEWHGYQTGPVLVAGIDGVLVATTAGGAVQVPGQSVATSAVASNLNSVPSPPGQSCFRGTTAEGALTISLRSTVAGSALALDLHFSAAVPMEATFGTATATTSAYNALATVLSVGQMERVVTWVEGTAADRLLVAAIAPQSRFCIQSIQVGGLVTLPDHAGICHAIDYYGQLVRPVSCGAPWE